MEDPLKKALDQRMSAYWKTVHRRESAGNGRTMQIDGVVGKALFVQHRQILQDSIKRDGIDWYPSN